MNKLQNLIKERCPNGVDYVEIKNVAEVGTGNSDRKDAVEDGEYPFYVRSKEIFKINRYEYDETAIVIPGEGGIGEIFHFVKGKYALHQRAYRIHLLDDRIDAKFLYYYMVANFKSFIMKKAVSATVTSIRKPMIEEFEIPVPPIEVQQEIVRILDKFTELEAELQIELDARKKQYEYYRDKLMDNVEGRSGKLIEMLCQSVTDGPHTTPKLVSEGIPFISATAIHEGRIHFEDAQGFITKEFDDECAKKYKPKRDDVYMVKSGSTTGKVGYVDTDVDFNIWSPLAAMRVNSECSARYLFHLLQTQSIQFQVSTRMSHGSQPNLSMRVLEQFDVIIPTLQEQTRIVNILEKYDTLCNDNEKGLPAEIEARHKQYEFYRDKLLTFERKVV